MLLPYALRTRQQANGISFKFLVLITIHLMVSGRSIISMEWISYMVSCDIVLSMSRKY